MLHFVMSCWLACFPFLAQNYPYVPPAPTSGGGGTPALSTQTCASGSPAGSTITMSAFTAVAGSALYLTFFTSTQDSAGTNITSITSKAGGVSTSDTFTQINFKSQTFATIYGYSVFNLTGGSYVIAITGSMGVGIICLTQITHVSSVVANCVGAATSTSAPCATTVTPTTSPAVVLGGIGSYYFSATFSVSSPYALGAQFANSGNGPGSAGSLGDVCTSSCTSPALTPTFTVAGGSYYTVTTGAIFQ
jgi:hypothetical protein